MAALIKDSGENSERKDAIRWRLHSYNADEPVNDLKQLADKWIFNLRNQSKLSEKNYI